MVKDPCEYCIKAYTCSITEMKDCEIYQWWLEKEMAKEQMIANYKEVREVSI
jgi:hypothetical protein